MKNHIKKPKLLIITSIFLISLGVVFIFISLPYSISVVEITKDFQARFGNMLSQVQIQEASRTLIRNMRIQTTIGLISIVCGLGLLKIKKWARNLLLILSVMGSIYLIYLIYFDIFIKHTIQSLVFRASSLIILVFIIVILNVSNIKKPFIMLNQEKGDGSI